MGKGDEETMVEVIDQFGNKGEMPIVPNIEKSIGHICFIHGYEYYAGLLREEVYCADMNSRVDFTGERVNHKRVCSVQEWNKRQIGKVFPVR